MRARLADATSSLTYEAFFGLREKAFSLSADPRFLYKSPAHAPAFDALFTGIRRREGLIVLTGEIGSGKTTVCRSVLQQLDRRTFAAFVPDPFVSREDLLKTLLVDFGVVSVADLKAGLSRATRFDLSYLLYEFLDSLVPLQAFAVVVIDEAQNLTLPLLEEIRILSELERREKMLQVVLVGQPELRTNLKLPQMRQVDQRVSVRHELTPLDGSDVAEYVRHRLQVASGGDYFGEFTEEALAVVARGSAGVPRLINRICDRALQRAYEARSLQIDSAFIHTAMEDLGLDSVGSDVVVAVAPTPVIAAATPGAAAAAADSFAPQDVLADVASVEHASTVIAEAPRMEAPPATVVRITSEDATGLPEFASERATTGAALRAQSAERAMRSRLGFQIAAALLAATVISAGVGAWYLYNDRLDAAAVAALMPPPSRPTLRAVATPSLPEEALPTTNTSVAQVSSAPPQAEEYLIQVASFTSRARAERLVAELTSAGYRAREVERDFGPPRGRMLQVIVGGYTSALDVERDLRRIRELPGYADSHILR